MDEQNVLASEDVCESPNLERSKISVQNSAKREEFSSRLPLPADHTHFLPADRKQRSADKILLSVPESRASGIEGSANISAENQRFPGCSDGLQHVDVSSSHRKRFDGSGSNESFHAGDGKMEILGDACSQMQAGITVDVDVGASPCQPLSSVAESAVPQEVNGPANAYAKDAGEMPGNPEIKQVAVLLSNRQVNAYASADSGMTPKTLSYANHCSTDEAVDVAPKGIPMHLDGSQQAGASDIVRNPVQSLMEEGCGREASLEMLSVAVESFENMHRESKGVSGGAREAVERTMAGKKHLVHDIEHDAVEAEHNVALAKYGILESSAKKLLGDSEDNGGFIFNDKVLGKDLPNRDHFLNLLCELAAVQQQEQEVSGKRFDRVTSCAESFVENELGGEPKRLSFVDLLRKQMAQAGALSESTVDAFYEQFLRQNQAILGTTLIKNFNLSLPSAGISSNNGETTAVEVEHVFNGDSDRDGDAMSKEEIIDDFRNAEAQDEVGGHSSRDDEKKDEIRGEAKKFGVGDLVWAKVKSHPWWPGQIFNAADASRAAKKIQRPGRTLVAFFGDGTFGWLQQSQLIAFRPNFEEKVKQTTMKSFCKAVAEALNEVSRRTELGLRCAHSSDAIYSTDVFPDLNAGMRKGVRIKRHQDIRMSRERLEPNRILEFIQTAACSPCYSLSSGLEYSELCGHVYGFRNFMLSPKKPKSKTAAQNVLMVQNKLASAESSSLKRRLGLDQIGDSSSAALGKQVKRLHLSKDKTSEEEHARNGVQSSKFRNIENLVFTESDERKELELENKSPEHVKGSTWLAKGKRLQASPDGKEGKRAKGWHLLGPLGDLAGSGGADNLTGTDDDLKTLLDITGYRSLKRKKKGGTSKSIMDVVAKKVEQQPLEARETHFSKESLSKVEVIWEEGGNFPDSSTSSLSTVVPDYNLSIVSMTKECDMAEECDKIKEELPDSILDDAEEMEKGNRELLDSKVSDAGKMEGEDSSGLRDSKMGDGQESVDEEGELHALSDTVAEAEEAEKEESVVEVSDAGESEKGEEKLLDMKESTALLQDVTDLDNIPEKQIKGLHSHSQEQEKENRESPNMKVGDAEGSEKDKGKSEKLSECILEDAKEEYDNIFKGKKQLTKHLHLHSPKHEKGKEDLQDLKVVDAEESEEEKGKILGLKDAESLLQGVSDCENVLKKKKQQKKRLHAQEEDVLSLLVKPKKRKQKTDKEEEKESSPSPENEQLGSKKSVKSFKSGASMKKAVGSLKGTPGSLKMATKLSAKKAVSTASIDVEVQKHLKSPRYTQLSAFKNVADENRNSSLAKLLNNLQAVARDPVSSATMKSSLHGVMSTFLRFRSMVFLKSSGYGAAGVGKSISSCGNGHLAGEKKVDDKGGAGKKNLPLERQKSFVTDSSEERKSVVKAELPSESVGPGSQTHAGQAAMKRPSPPSTALASQKSDMAKMSTDTEAASGEMPSCPNSMTGGGQQLGVQELAVAARKKKSEVLKESAAKVQVKNEVLKGQNSFKERADKEKFTDARHHAKSVKHHISRGETLSLPERKSPMYNSAGVKVAQTSLGLFMQFPEDFALPSEAQLKEVFNPFGILEVAGIRVYKNASTAQVVFKHSTDAEAAWQHARKNRMFGHTNVSYRLRHFSLSTKSNAKLYEIASGKNGVPAEAAAVKSSLVESHRRPHDVRSSLPSGAEQGSSREAADSPVTRISSVSRVEPADTRMSAQSPTLSKAELVLSPVRSTLVSRGEPGGTTVPELEPSPIPILPHIRAEPVAPTVSTPGGSFSSGADQQGGFTLPACDAAAQKQEALPNLGARVPLYSNPANVPSVSNVDAPCGDIRDELLKLLQQVSVIVSSSTLIPRTA